jgi:hypothetical protein
MKIPLIKPRLFVTVKEPGGKISLDTELPCHSYTWNFYMGIIGQLFGAAKLITYGTHLIDITGTNKEDSTTPANIFMGLSYDLAAVGDDSVGLVVGKGTSPWALGNFALSDQITNGIGSGKLNYGQQVAATKSDAGADRTVTSMRSFYNNSPSVAITVYEVAKYVSMYAGGTYRECMIFRDLLDTPIVVPTGGGELQVKLQSTLTYPTTIS